MYTIPNTIRNKIYEDGGVIYTPIVKIGDITLAPSQIRSIKLDNPIIDNTETTLRLGSFISSKLTIVLSKSEALDLSKPIDFRVKMTAGEEEVTVPMGIFHIETSPVDYYKKAQIVALDNAVLFKDKVNIHQFFTTVYNEEDVLVDEYITAENLLIALCNHFNVTLGTYPNVNRDKRTSSYDSTLSGKQYISWIAKVMGGNAKIGRNGELNIIPFGTIPVTEIDVLKGESFALADTQYVEDNTLITKPYRASQVRYDNGEVEFHFPNTAITHNVMPVDTNNIFINGTLDEMKAVVENIANAVVGFEANRLSFSGVADITLDSTDLVTFAVGGTNYKSLYNGEITFTGAKPMIDISVDIPSTNVENTTNTLGGDDVTEVKRLQTIVDQLNNKITTLATRTQAMSDNLDTQYREISDQVSSLDDSVTSLESLTTSMTRELTDTYTKEEVNAIITGRDENNNVVTVVKTTNSTLDINGFTIDGNVDVKSTLSPSGLSVLDKTKNDEEILYAGYNSSLNETQVRTKNIKVEKYFEMGKHIRIQDYTNSVNYAIGIGFFWVGD